MAEGVVGLLIGKLGAALLNEAAAYAGTVLCKEADALNGLFSKISDVKSELESIQAYLQYADERFKDTDTRTGIFIKDIRRLSFEIEDIVDVFTYKLEDKHGGFIAKMKKGTKRVQTWRELTRKLLKIQESLQDLDRRRSRYGITEPNNSKGESSGYIKFACQSFRSGREKDLVGIKENKEILMDWLTVDSEQGRRICTVWGMGGIGKTALVTHVYDIIKVDYDTAAWITVSKNYRVEELLRKIVKEFGISADDITDTRQIEVIHNYLQGKRYLLVLDDVWGVDVWFRIMGAFPTDNDSTGRFIITSRIYDVALLGKTSTRNYVIHLEELGKDHSWELFCKEAFWKNEDQECPPELRNLACQFLEKCNGLPIAIACIGRLLSCKPDTVSEWENVYKKIESQLTENVIVDVNIILKVSLEDLPYDLKNCFMHCVVYNKKEKGNKALDNSRIHQGTTEPHVGGSSRELSY